MNSQYLDRPITSKDFFLYQLSPNTPLWKGLKLDGKCTYRKLIEERKRKVPVFPWNTNIFEAIYRGFTGSKVLFDDVNRTRTQIYQLQQFVYSDRPNQHVDREWKYEVHVILKFNANSSLQSIKAVIFAYGERFEFHFSLNDDFNSYSTIVGTNLKSTDGLSVLVQKYMQAWGASPGNELQNIINSVRRCISNKLELNEAQGQYYRYWRLSSSIVLLCLGDRIIFEISGIRYELPVIEMNNQLGILVLGEFYLIL